MFRSNQYVWYKVNLWDGNPYTGYMGARGEEYINAFDKFLVTKRVVLSASS